MRTSSTSPGIAPLISIGPVSTCPEGPRSFTSRNMSRWYCGIALGGTTPDWSMISGANNDDVSIVTVSPDAMLSTGFRLDAKCPMCTVCGLGIRVNSAVWPMCGTAALPLHKPPPPVALRIEQRREVAVVDARGRGFRHHCLGQVGDTEAGIV